jgi:Carboxypeptidase regulatory-like domain/TonB dependent receptor
MDTEKIGLAKSLFVLLAICLLSIFHSVTFAQSQTTGRVAGLVQDSSSAVVASAEVTVTNELTGEERKVTTDETGRYSVPLLPAGVYRISMTAPGFRSAVFPEVSVAVTETTQLDANLAVGPISDSITVRTLPPLVQQDGPQLGRVVDSTAVSVLPLATRNYTQILGLSPGTATFLPDSTALGRNTQAISVNGARVTQNNIQLNGVAGTIGTNAAILAPVPAPEAIQEFKVQTSLYDATFGVAGGANIQVLTKSGGNNFHGALYEYFRNEALNANNPFLKAAGVARPVLKRNVYGATLGGPVHKNRSFFFVSYQGTREINGASIVNSISSNVLVAKGLTDDRSEHALLSTFAVPSITPPALALLNARLPDGQFLIPTPQPNGFYSGSSRSTYQEEQFNTNFDFRPGANDTLAVKFFFGNTDQAAALPSFRGTGPNVPGFGTNQSFNNRVVAIQDIHVFSPTLLNEIRIGYAGTLSPVTPEEPITDEQVGIARANARSFPGLPLIRIAPSGGGVIIGTPTNLAVANTSTSTLYDSLSVIRGKHTLRGGLEFRYNTADFAQNQFIRGQIDFPDFPSFLTGTTQVTTFGTGKSTRSQRAWDYNFFLQDDWKASPRLTLNLGLRYELDLPVFDTRGRLNTFDPELYRPRPEFDGNGPIGPPIGGFVQSGNVTAAFDLPDVPEGSKSLLKHTDLLNFAPRVGFAYSLLPSEKIVARGGYGIFYSRPTFQYASQVATMPPGYVLGVRNNGARLADPFFAVPAQEEFPTFVPGVALAGNPFDRNLRTPYVQQFGLSLQHEASRDLLLEIAYVGTRGLNLFRQVAINQARLASPQNPVTNEVTGAVLTTNTQSNAPLRAPFQGVSVTGFTQNQTSAQSSYHSLQLSMTKRFSRGLQFLGSYTYAKSLDNASGAGAGAGITGLVNTGAVGDTSAILGNQLVARANRGVSDFDRTHRFVLSYSWDLPAPHFVSGSRAARLTLSGWQLTGIATAMSGLPIDIVDTNSGSFYGLSSGSNPLARPSMAAGAACGVARKNAPEGYFFNPYAFVRPVIQAGQVIPSSGGAAIAGGMGTDIGDVPRNCLRGPQQVNMDLGLVKHFPLRESTTVEFRAEFFNFFNHVNLANPISNFNAIIGTGGTINTATGQVITAGSFGRAISASNNPRLIQFALKLNF